MKSNEYVLICMRKTENASQLRNISNKSLSCQNNDQNQNSSYSLIRISSKCVAKIICIVQFEFATHLREISSKCAVKLACTG